MYNKNLAGVFAILLGLFGVHRFYVGQRLRGALQFGAFWFFVFVVNTATYNPKLEVFAGIMIATLVLLPFLTGVIWLAMPEEKWRAKYDKDNATARTQVPGEVGRAVPDARQLKSEGIRYYKTGDYDLAIEAFQEAAGADPTDAGTQFNLACSFAQLGQYPQALRHLEWSLTFGLPKPGRIERHPALAKLREHSSYQRFRANNFRQLDFQELVNPARTEAATSAPVPDAPADEAPTPETGDVPGDLLDQFARLRELHDAGVLTQREYQEQKEKLMG